MRARLDGERAELVGDSTWLRFHINCRQLAIYLRAISDELPYERPFIGRVLSRWRVAKFCAENQPSCEENNSRAHDYP
jgi:hypothetical protein